MATAETEVCPVCRCKSKHLSSHFHQSPLCQKLHVNQRQTPQSGTDNTIPIEIGGDEETNIDRRLQART
jgi:hypothetical protein